MNGTYRISFQARLDLDGIWESVATDNRTAADRLLATFRARFAMLARQPLMGEMRGDLRIDVRGSYVGSYAIYYRLIDDASVEIVRVVHGARDTRDMF